MSDSSKPVGETRWQTFMGMLKKEACWLCSLGIALAISWHGLPFALHIMLKVGKKDILSEELLYSRHDLWVAQQGFVGIFALILLARVLYRWIRFWLKAPSVTPPSCDVER